MQTQYNTYNPGKVWKSGLYLPFLAGSGGFGMLFGRTPYLSHEQVEFAQFAELLSRPPPAVHSAVRGSWKRVPKKLTSPC